MADHAGGAAAGRRQASTATPIIVRATIANNWVCRLDIEEHPGDKARK
jgi:hypothetical protein